MRMERDGYFKKWKVNLFIFLERLISKRTDAFFVVSNKTKKDLQNVKIGLNKPWHVVHPGVILRSEPSSFNSRANILWVGRFEEIKNPMLALESLLILRNKFKTNIKLIMIGNGSPHSKCVKYGKENNLNVDFPGWITDQEQIYLKSKSLPQAVKVDVSIAREIIGKGLLLIFGLSLTKNSAERCWASAAEPPFPQIKILPLFLIVEKIFSIDKNTSLLSPINFFLISKLSKISPKY